MKLVLLPGLDGTGELFQSFLAALPSFVQPVVVRYPTSECLPYVSLLPFVEAAAGGEEAFVLLAESFSSPLAIQYAATRPEHLKAVVIVAGFASSPVQDWRRVLCLRLAPWLFRLPLTDFAAGCCLIGKGAEPQLFALVRAAISSVEPHVLEHRLCSVLACDARTELSSLTVPLLHLLASRDRLVMRSSAEEMLQLQPHMLLAEIDGPHLLLQREPERSAAYILGFLQTLLPLEA